MAEVGQRLTGHITGIDHTGWNIPSARLERPGWQALLAELGRQCNLYRYPSGEDWPFIVPATIAEFTGEIIDFVVGRQPRFELVYDTSSPATTLQFDLETDLNRAEVERLFPEPYGTSFPGLGNYFRSVYVHHPWPGLNIRFDVRFAGDPDNPWTTGQWLVRDGGRIRP